MLIALLIMSYLLTTSCAYLGPVQRLGGLPSSVFRWARFIA